MSAVIVSFIESFLLLALGFLKVNNLLDFLIVTVFLAIVEIVLVVILEELIVSAKATFKIMIKNKKIKKLKSKDDKARNN